MYCVPDQEGKEYVEPDFGGVLLGTDNIFGTRVIRSEGSLPDLEEGAEDKEGEEGEDSAGAARAASAPAANPEAANPAPAGDAAQ